MSAGVTSPYAAWVSWLEAFRRGENPPVDGLGPIDGRLGSYVEARLLDRVSVAFGERVRQWQTALGDRIVARPPVDATEAAALLREAVDRLDPLNRLAASPLLPRGLGVSMHTVLGEVRDGARSALDDAQRHLAEPTVPVPDIRAVPGARAAPDVRAVPRVPAQARSAFVPA